MKKICWMRHWERMYSCGNGFAFCAFMGSGEQAEETAELLFGPLEKRLKQNGIDENHFRRLQKKAVGQTLRLFQSISAIGLTQIELTPFDADLSDHFSPDERIAQKRIWKNCCKIPLRRIKWFYR